MARKTKQRLSVIGVVLIVGACVVSVTKPWRPQYWVKLPDSTILLRPEIRYGTNVTFRTGSPVSLALWSALPSDGPDKLEIGKLALERPYEERFAQHIPHLFIKFAVDTTSISQRTKTPAGNIYQIEPEIRIALVDEHGSRFHVEAPHAFNLDSKRGTSVAQVPYFPRRSETLRLTLETQDGDANNQWSRLAAFEFKNSAEPQPPTWAGTSASNTVSGNGIQFHLDSISIHDNAAFSGAEYFWDINTPSAVRFRFLVEEPGSVNNSTMWAPIIGSVEDDSGNSTPYIPSRAISRDSNSGVVVEGPLIADPTRMWRIEVFFARIQISDTSPVVHSAVLDGDQSFEIETSGLEDARIFIDDVDSMIALETRETDWAILRWPYPMAANPSKTSEDLHSADADSRSVQISPNFFTFPEKKWNSPPPKLRFDYVIAPTQRVVFFLKPTLDERALPQSH